MKCQNHSNSFLPNVINDLHADVNPRGFVFQEQMQLDVGAPIYQQFEISESIKSFLSHNYGPV